jgi:membrane-associated phospholipid phosphatase
MLALAASVAYSRMYLSMHFLEDVIGGASIAVVVTSLILIYRTHVHWKWLNMRFSLKAKKR